MTAAATMAEAIRSAVEAAIQQLPATTTSADLLASGVISAAARNAAQAIALDPVTLAIASVDALNGDVWARQWVFDGVPQITIRVDVDSDDDLRAAAAIAGVESTRVVDLDDKEFTSAYAERLVDETCININISGPIRPRAARAA